MSKSSSTKNNGSFSSAAKNQTTQMMSDEVFQIDQCLFPVPEEFFMKDEQSECISAVDLRSRKSSDIPCVPGCYTKLEDLIDKEQLSAEVIAKLCFNEMLLISSSAAADDNGDDEMIVGGLAIQVETIADEVIAIFCSSQFSMGDERTARSELLTLTDRQFNPFQERKCETVLAGDFKQEKQLQLYFNEDQTVSAYRQEIVADKSESFQGILAAGEDGLLVPDGLNILFTRYLIVTNFVGEIHTRTIDIQGRIGHSLYQITAPIPSKINGEVLDTKQVIRTIYYADSDEPETSISYYLTSGHLLRHTWNNSNYAIICHPQANLQGLPVDMTDLCTTMRIYLEELAKLLEGIREDDHQQCTKTVPRQTEIVRAVLSEILRDATEKAAVTRRLSEQSMGTDNVRDVLVDIINQMALL